MEHFPGVHDMVCICCFDTYTLHQIWQETGCDCHEESGNLKCYCGHTIDFVLNLDYNDNKERLIVDLTTRDPRCLDAFHLIKDVLGEVRLTTHEGVKLEFINTKKCNLAGTSTSDECVVCYDNTCARTMCGHIVCASCYDKLDRCPYCRGDLFTTDTVMIRSKIGQQCVLAHPAEFTSGV